MKQELGQNIEKFKLELFELSQYIYDNPEIGFKEYKACKKLCDFLTKYGFKITTNAGGLETAFVAEACPTGISYPQIDILGEYDALGLGDSFGKEYSIVHACGHNIIATCAVGAGISLLEIMKKNNISGTLRIVGTPAEEGGGGKIIMQENGVFNKTDAMIMIHPTSGTSKIAGKCKSSITMKIKYNGLGAHAGNHKERGINAQDAANICYMSIGCLRYQLPDDVQVFPQFVHNGNAKAIIPDTQEMSISIRCFKPSTLETVIPKIKNCVEAGALATGCTVTIEESLKYYGRLCFHTLEKLIRKNCELLNEPLMDGMVNDNGGEDFGNLIRKVPGIMFYPSLLLEKKISNHTPEFYKLCNSERANEVIILGSKVLAYTALDLFENTKEIELAKQELKELLKQDI